MNREIWGWELGVQRHALIEKNVDAYYSRSSNRVQCFRVRPFFLKRALDVSSRARHAYKSGSNMYEVTVAKFRVSYTVLSNARIRIITKSTIF